MLYAASYEARCVHHLEQIILLLWTENSNFGYMAAKPEELMYLSKSLAGFT